MWRSPAFECVGAVAVRRRYENILAAIPDYESRVRTGAVDVIENRAIYTVVQTGTVTRDLADRRTADQDAAVLRASRPVDRSRVCDDRAARSASLTGGPFFAGTIGLSGLEVADSNIRLRMTDGRRAGTVAVEWALSSGSTATSA